jgi:hypothetical protein
MDQVDPHGDRGSGGGTKDDTVESAEEPVCLVDSSASGVGVVVDDNGCGTGMPPAANFDTHTRFLAQVLYGGTFLAVFRDEPKDVTVESITDWRLA